MSPIIEFKDINEAMNCLKEWKDRLYLNDWIIQFNPFVIADENTDYYGLSTINSTNKTATINLVKPTIEFKCKLTTFCIEQTLVHELLHLKYDFPDNLEICDAYFEAEQHKILEQMSRSFIMAKYGISRQWFDNTIEGE